ncbi:MAG: hypothetical protein ACREHG_01850 [Candidatus Saccharimonadales bacterium]
MTVRQLRFILKDFNQDASVLFASDTQCARIEHCAFQGECGDNGEVYLLDKPVNQAHDNLLVRRIHYAERR